MRRCKEKEEIRKTVKIKMGDGGIFNFSTFLCEMSMMQTSAFLFGSKKNASKVFLHICNFLSSQRQIFQKFLQNLEFLGIACHSLTTQPSCGEVVFILRYLMSQISAESNVYGT